MRGFLELLREVLRSFIQTLLGRQSPDAVGAEEPLTRYIYSRRQFNPSRGTVDATAFMPEPSPRETSVYRIDGLETEAISEIGARIGRDRQRTMHARADLTAHHVTSVELRVQPDPPPEHHAVIIGWPDDKDATMSRAQVLAALSRLVLAP